MLIVLEIGIVAVVGSLMSIMIVLVIMIVIIVVVLVMMIAIMIDGREESWQSQNNLDLVKALLARSIDVNRRDADDRNTALHLAMSGSSLEERHNEGESG